MVVAYTRPNKKRSTLICGNGRAIGNG